MNHKVEDVGILYEDSKELFNKCIDYKLQADTHIP